MEVKSYVMEDILGRNVQMVLNMILLCINWTLDDLKYEAGVRR